MPISSGIKCGLCIIIASDAVSCFELINLLWLCWATVPRLTLYVRLCIISLFLGAMDLPIFTVDSFTEAPFQGNPAAVCIVQYASQTVRRNKQTIKLGVFKILGLFCSLSNTYLLLKRIHINKSIVRSNEIESHTTQTPVSSSRF